MTLYVKIGGKLLTNKRIQDDLFSSAWKSFMYIWSLVQCYSDSATLILHVSCQVKEAVSETPRLVLMKLGRLKGLP